MRAYRALERYPAERRRELHLRAWLYQIVLNVVRNRVRRHDARRVVADGCTGRRTACRPARPSNPRRRRAERSAGATWPADCRPAAALRDARWCCATSRDCRTPKPPRCSINRSARPSQTSIEGCACCARRSNPKYLPKQGQRSSMHNRQLFDDLRALGDVRAPRRLLDGHSGRDRPGRPLSRRSKRRLARSSWPGIGTGLGGHEDRDRRRVRSALP